MRAPLFALLITAAVAIAFSASTQDLERAALPTARLASASVAVAANAEQPASARAEAPQESFSESAGSEAIPLFEPGAAPLFEPVDAAEVAEVFSRPVDRAVYRQRFVRSDPARFVEASALVWNLFDDLAEPVVLDDARWKSFDGSKLSWHGHVAGDPGSEVLVLVNNGAVTANVSLTDGRLFAIDTVAPGIQRVQEINAEALPRCASEPDPALADALAAEGESAPPPPPTASASAGPELIDVLQLYTPGARDHFGGTQALEDRLELLIDWSNLVYQNSAATQRLRSAGILEVAYDDAHGNGGTALDDLTFSGDGELEGVPALRDQYGADMVSLFTRPNGICGIAWVASSASAISWYDDYMYSVVNVECIGNPRSFTHELAHNQGAYHDPETALSQGMTQAEIDATSYPNSFGYIEPSDSFRTIMAYGSSCGWCAPLEQFSNKNLTYLGAPTGTNRSNVHETLEATYVTIAGFRAAVACTGQGDTDGDGVCDSLDNCLQRMNADQLDGDLDGYGNACDADYDNNGLVGTSDFAVIVPMIGTTSASSAYDERLDHTGDGAIGVPDFSYMIGQIGNAPGPSALACAGTVPCSN
jgi:hypothetical protein